MELDNKYVSIYLKNLLKVSSKVYPEYIMKL